MRQVLTATEEIISHEIAKRDQERRQTWRGEQPIKQPVARKNTGRLICCVLRRQFMSLQKLKARESYLVIAVQSQLLGASGKITASYKAQEKARCKICGDKIIGF
jgi:hypothetical protein